MSRFGVMAHALRSNRTIIISGALGLAVLAFFITVIYPSFEESLREFEDQPGIEGFLGDIDDIASPEGYLQSQLYTFLAVIVISLGIAMASAAIVGEERDGTLDLLMAQPVTRQRIILEKAGALATLCVVVNLASLPAVMLGAIIGGFDISFARLWWATIASLVTTIVYIAMCLWLSALLPTRGAAAMATAGLMIIGYMLHLLGPINGALDAARHISPFYWGDTSRPLNGDFDFLPWLGLLAASALFVVLALRAFERRDITPGPRDWSWFSLLRRRTPARPNTFAEIDAS